MLLNDCEGSRGLYFFDLVTFKSKKETIYCSDSIGDWEIKAWHKHTRSCMLQQGVPFLQWQM